MKTLIRPLRWQRKLPKLLPDNRLVTEWVARQIPHVDTFGPATAIGVLSGAGERLIAGCVYHDYQPRARTIQLSFAATQPWWARYEIVRGLLHYPFVQLDVYRAYTLSSMDSPMVTLLPRLGFHEEAVLIAGFGPAHDALLCRLLQPQFTALYEQSFIGPPPLPPL